MDIQNLIELQWFIDTAEDEQQKYQHLNKLPPDVLHDTLIDNPILHENYVVSDVYECNRYLTI